MKGENGSPAAAVSGIPPHPQAERIIIWALATAAFTLLVTLPFVSRAFDLDEVIFLKFAEAATARPLVLELQDFAYFGVFNESFIDTHPPLVSSYLALMMNLGGDSETWLHLSFTIFPLMAALSMMFLALKFSRNGVFAGLILMATPGAMVLSHTVMSDMPGLAFWLAATALYVYGLDRRNLAMMTACAVVLALGVMTSYQVLGMVPLLFFYAALKRQLSLLAVLPLVLPISVFASFSLWHLTATGALPSLSHVSYVEKEPLAAAILLEKIVHLLAAVGGATIFPLVLLRLIFYKKTDVILFACVFLPVAVLAFFRHQGGAWSGAEALLIPLLLPVGAVFLAMACREAWRRFRQGRNEDERAFAGILLLWIAGAIFSIVFLQPYSSIKYVLPLIGPLVLLFVWMVENQPGGASQRSVRNMLVAALLGTAALGLVVSFADFDLAGSKRFFAETQATGWGRDAEASGNHRWFSSEFGDRYYLEKQGFEELHDRSLVNGGDLVILPLLAGTNIPTEFDGRLQLVERVSMSGETPVRVTDDRAGAGLFGSRWGPLPYSISQGSVGEYAIYRVINP